MDELLDSVLVLVLIVSVLIATVWFAAGAVWLARKVLDRLIGYIRWKRFSSRWR